MEGPNVARLHDQETEPAVSQIAVRGGAVGLDEKLSDPDMSAFMDGVCAGNTGSMQEGGGNMQRSRIEF